MRRLAPYGAILALSGALPVLGCQSAAGANEPQTRRDAGHDGAMAGADATSANDDSGATIDAAHNAPEGAGDASTDAALDASMATLDATHARDATSTTDAGVRGDAAPSDAAAPDASADNTDAGAAMCRTAGPCRTDDECCWFCHDQDHCH